jgi:arylsulfatase A-like enzyme
VRSVLLLLLVACNWGSRPAPKERVKPAEVEKPARRKEIPEDRLSTTSRKIEGVTPRRIADLAPGEPAVVVLVVVDTLRADRASLCGYEHPTTPTMIAVRDAGALWTCDAYSPATWTLPAHASYFTGVPTGEHGVHTLGTRLEDRYETLAETWAARGYQTVFLSGNPVFASEAIGFWQGFERVVSAKALVGPMRGGPFSDILTTELSKLDKDRPLFLVVNIFDAHDPYPPVPTGIPWAKAQPRTNLLPHTARPDNPYYAFVTGNMKAEDQPGYLEIIHNAYQWSVHAADTNLGLLLKQLKQDGWLKNPHRLVITSDHGEHLGEHQLLRHGSATWQTVTRVPFLYLDTTGAAPAGLPEPLNATTAYYLLRDGKLPEPALPVESASAQNPEDFKPSWFTFSMWASRTDKLTHFDGKDWRFDLATDPGEERPGPIPADHPLYAVMQKKLTEQRASVQAALERAPDAGVMEMLKSVGYVQDNEHPPEEAKP